MLTLLFLACFDDKIILVDSADPVDSPTESDAPDSPEDSPEDSPVDSADLAWETFEAQREDHLRALAAPIADCVTRSDTRHPVFDGCIDWHSAVHGHWALLALSRTLGEPEWAELVDASLTAEDLAAELAIIESGRPSEIPYGYAWFLALARERMDAGDTDLDAMAEAVAAGLEQYLVDLSPQRATATISADDYPNYSWAVLNLWAWSVQVGDTSRAAVAEQLVREVLMPAQCPLEAEIGGEDNFFPACLMRAHAVLRVLPPEETADWLAALLPADYPIEPVTNITFAHLGGLNFSRSWGLWTLYEATGDTAWRDRTREHVQWHMAHPQYWAQDYYSYSHWVGQFGVYAIVASIDRPVDG